MVSQKGFNPKTKKSLEHVGTVTWAQPCWSCAPSPARGCSASWAGTLLVLQLLWPVMVWGLGPAPRNRALSDQVGGGSMEWRRMELSFLFGFLQVCGCELTMVWSGNAGKGEDRVRELWTSGQTREEAEQQDLKRQCLIVICQPGCAD